MRAVVFGEADNENFDVRNIMESNNAINDTPGNELFTVCLAVSELFLGVLMLSEWQIRRLFEVEEIQLPSDEVRDDRSGTEMIGE